MTIGIYKITCKQTGLCYIGQSKNIEARWKGHQRKRFPIENFDYEILVTCPIKDLNELEILMIKTFDSHRNGLNKTIGGTLIKITHPSEETRRKMSEIKKGKKRSLEFCINASISKVGNKNPMYGKPSANRGKPMSNEQKQKLRVPKKKISCPHCRKEGGNSNMRRYHFNNCKFKTMEEN